MPININNNIINKNVVDALEHTSVIQPGLRVHLDPDVPSSMSGRGVEAVADISGNNHTINRARMGAAVTFDGSNDFIDIGNKTELGLTSGDATVCVWLFVNSGWTGGDQYPNVISKGATAGWDTAGWSIFCFRPSSGSSSVGFAQRNGSTSNYLQTTITVDTWHLIVGTRDTNLKLYVDGALANTTGRTIYAEANSTSVYIGRDTARFFNGHISDVKIFNEALSANQIAEQYRNPSEVLPNNISASSLIGWWPMSESSGTIAYDCSTVNSNHGILTNSPSRVNGMEEIPQVAGRGQSQKMKFDGNDDDLGTGLTLDELKYYTFSWWSLSSATGRNDGAWGMSGGPAAGSFNYNWYGGARPLLYLAGSNYRYWPDNSAQDDGKWHHWLLTYAGGDGSHKQAVNSQLYIDGVEQGTTSQTNAEAPSSWGELRIGTNSASSNTHPDNHWDGQMDEFIVYDKRLGEAERADLYATDTNGMPLPPDPRSLGSSSNIIAYWRNDGNTWKDLSGNGYDASSTGSPDDLFFPKGITSGRDAQGFPVDIPSYRFTGTGGDNYIRVNVNSWIRTVTYITITGWWYHNANTGGGPFDVITDSSGGAKDGFWWHTTYSGNANVFLRTEDDTNGEADSNNLSSGVGDTPGYQPASIGNWYHTAVAVGTNRFKVYFDGSLYYEWRTNDSYAGHTAAAFSWANINSDTTYMWVGASYSTSINGRIGNIQLYDRELSLAEIKHNMNVGRDKFGV